MAAGILAATAEALPSSPAEFGHEPDPAPRAGPRLIWMPSPDRPADEILVGVRFTIEPGWHLYWHGRNDSGLAPIIEWTLPEGWTARDALWPAPTRHVSPGDILDHIYEKDVTIIVPVRIPERADARRGVVEAELQWLVCRDVCLAEKAHVSLAIDASRPAPAPPAEAARAFADASARLPRPWSQAGDAASLTWGEHALTVEFRGARALTFYPLRECVALLDPIADAHARGERLTLRIDPDAPPSPADRVAGVLEVLPATGDTPLFFRLDEAIPPASGVGSEPEHSE